MMHAAASEASVSSIARSAPVRYGSDESASQKMSVSKLASTRRCVLLHIGHRDLMLRRDLLQRPALLEFLHRGAERGPELRVRLAVVDPERVRLREEVRDRELAGVLLLLERTGRVLRQHRIGATD